MNANEIKVGDQVKSRTQIFTVVSLNGDRFVAEQDYKGQKHSVTFAFEDLDNPHLIRVDVFRNGTLIGSTNGRP